jgi:hypothetical protein
MWHDHTQPSNRGWSTPEEFITHPAGKSVWNWGCIQDSGRPYLATDKVSVFVPLGGSTAAVSTCTTSEMYWVFSRDNGHSWGVAPATDIQPVLNGQTVPTMEVSFANPTGETWIGFNRSVERNPAGVYGPFELYVTTDNGVTWAITTDSGLPHSPYCATIGYPFNGNGYQISPVIQENMPSKGLDTMFYTDRIGCGAAGYGVEMVVVFDPLKVVSGGAAYVETLMPQVVHGGIIAASNLDGYESVYAPTPSSFYLWYHGRVSTGVSNLNIFQLNGSFSK